MQMLLTVIVTWLVASQGLPPIDEPPRIEFVSPTRMAAVRRERSASTRPGVATAERLVPPEIEPDVHAFYDDFDRAIYLPEDWTAASPAHVSVLVHELVHHLQNVDGTVHACPAARERPAYRAQSTWLELHGSSLEDAFGIDAMTLLVRTHCAY